MIDMVIVVLDLNGRAFPCENGQVLTLEIDDSLHLWQFSAEYHGLPLKQPYPEKFLNFINPELILSLELLGALLLQLSLLPLRPFVLVLVKLAPFVIG